MKKLDHCVLVSKVIIIFLCLDWGFHFLGFDRTRQKLLRRIRRIQPASPSAGDRATLEEIVTAVDAGTI
jgi:hypothetical protein